MSTSCPECVRHSEEIGKIAFNASGGFIADFNQDGYLDVFVNNFDATASYVLWGPDFNQSTALPVESDHRGSCCRCRNDYRWVGLAATDVSIVVLFQFGDSSSYSSFLFGCTMQACTASDRRDVISDKSPFAIACLSGRLSFRYALFAK